MAVSGKIKTFPLTDLFQWISLSRKSGVLRISCGDYLIQVFFRKGVLVSAATSDPSRRFGQYLLARGFLDEAQLRRALDHQEKAEGERLLGEVLQQLKIMGRDRIERALRERAAELVYDLFLLEDGVFFFEEREGIPDNLVELNLNVDSLILEGVRRTDEWGRIRQVLPDDTVRVRILPGKAKFAGGAPELRGQILGLAGQDRTIAEIAMHTRRSPFDVYFELYRMLGEGCLEIAAAAPPAAATAPVLDLREFEGEIRRLAQTWMFQSAWSLLRDMQGRLLDPGGLAELERWLLEQENAFLRGRFRDTDVPWMKGPLDQIRREKLTPREGFLLSRLGTGVSVKNLCQVMPLAEVEILRLLDSLERKGVISFPSGMSGSGPAG
jgi:hypothetical protein